VYEDKGTEVQVEKKIIFRITLSFITERPIIWVFFSSIRKVFGGHE
jgi:hypothetical protein